MHTLQPQEQEVKKKLGKKTKKKISEHGVLEGRCDF